MLCTDEYPQAAPNQQKALTGEMGGAAAKPPPPLWRLWSILAVHIEHRASQIRAPRRVCIWQGPEARGVPANNLYIYKRKRIHVYTHACNQYAGPTCCVRASAGPDVCDKLDMSLDEIIRSERMLPLPRLHLARAGGKGGACK